MSMHKGLIGQSDGGGSVSSNNMYPHRDKTLGEYLNRKYKADAFDSVQQERKLTFDEWVHHRFPAAIGRFTLHDDSDLKDTLYVCWKAAQENK